jgi:hypothetical protein
MFFYNDLKKNVQVIYKEQKWENKWLSNKKQDRKKVKQGFT